MTLTDTMTDDRIILRVLSGAWLDGAADGLRLTARKKIALLAYLAMDRASVPRDLLAGLIWGDVPEPKARASLRQALSDLRAAHPALQRALVMDRTTVSLIPDQIAIETDMILDEIRQGRLPDSLRTGGECVNDFLYGFETLSERFGDWVRDMRKTNGDRILRALFDAARRDDLPPPTRIEFAEAATMLDPMGECTCRFAMQLAWDLGDIGKALQIYAAFYARMNDELDMDPSIDTQNLAARIKMAAPSDAGAAPQPLSAPVRPAAPAAIVRHHGRPVLAVLPMQTSGLTDDDSGIGDLLVENMTLRITRAQDISVVSQTSIRPLSDHPDVAHLLMERFGVRYVVNGHIRRVGASFHLNVELCKTDEGLVIWADRYQITADDLAHAQSRIADEVVNCILPNMHGAELSEAQQIDLTHLTAYHHLLRAQDLAYALDPATFDAAGCQLQTLVAASPEFAPAQVALSDWYSLRVGQGWSADVAGDLAASENHLVRALASDRRNGRALSMLGHKRAVYAHRYAEADVLFEEALSTSPGDAETLLWTGPALAFAGQTEEAISRLTDARALNSDTPLGFRYDHFLAIAYFAANRMEDAVRAGLASATRNGGYTSNLRLTAAAAAATGQADISIQMVARVLAAEPDFRVSSLKANTPFRCAAKGAEYRRLLVLAGLPA